MKSKVKAHQSDDEDDEVTTEVAVRPVSKEEQEKQMLANVPVIADSEISPAAYLF
jgi:hypothetical protein